MAQEYDESIVQEPGVPPRIVLKTSREIQELIPNYTMEDMMCDPSKEELYYLAYLCAKGNIGDVCNFLRGVQNVRLLLNTYCDYFDGTILHVALYFNSGEKGLELFDLLTSKGAIPCLSPHFEERPWQQKGTRWVLFMCSLNIPDEFHRDPSEFTWLYHTLALQHL